MVTIKDISKKCGVSPATVSKALNGYSDISEETAKKIRKAAEEMHYFPNAAARLLKTNTSHNIGVVFEDETMSGLTHEYFSHILNSAKYYFERNGYDITFICQSIGGKSFTDHIRYRKCDGVLIACVDFTAPDIRELIDSEIPTVTIDYSFDGHSCIMSDNYEGQHYLTKYLIDMGHTRIAFIHGEKTSVTEKRLTGFYKACHEAGIAVPEEYVTQGSYHNGEVSSEATERLMNLSVKPTAIMYPDDFAYIGGKAKLDYMGYRVPLDVSVVGYDGIPLSSVIRPKLTTWYQDAVMIGEKGAEKLIEQIEHEKTCMTEQIKISGKFKEGETVLNINEQ